MLAQLTRYLRGALPRMRENETTLAEEIDLVSAYLGVQKIRMGRGSRPRSMRRRRCLPRVCRQ